jgi:hypothetical protein
VNAIRRDLLPGEVERRQRRALIGLFTIFHFTKIFFIFQMKFPTAVSVKWRELIASPLSESETSDVDRRRRQAGAYREVRA